MRRTFAAIMAFGVAAVLSGVTFVHADCAYHKTQAGVDKSDATKQVVSAPTTDQTDANQVLTARAAQPTQPAPIKK